MKPQARFNPQFDDYHEGVSDFAKPIMAHLRDLVHRQCPEVVERMKWGVPHFDHAGETLCVFAAYRKHCSFSFGKAALMRDVRLQASVNLKATERFMGKLTALSDLPSDRELMALIKEAMALNDKGAKPALRRSTVQGADIAIPQAFAEQLARDERANEVFQSKPPSFRKDYIVWIADAKTEATQQKRIDTALVWIAEGKRRFWQYAKK